MVADPAELQRFYEEGYSREPAEAALYARWRALGALGKADHVIALCAAAGIEPASTLDVGCGDGSLLSELNGRGFGGRLSGVEISERAAAIARSRPAIASVAQFDGYRLPAADAAHELGVLSHVLEHVTDPAALLRETGRACSAVVVEVPLEANLSARRRSKRVHAAEIGHLQRLDRDALRLIVAAAGLSIAGEIEDPLPLRAHTFFAHGTRERVLATARWAVRASLHRCAPALARRLFTVHYACLCLRAG